VSVDQLNEVEQSKNAPRMYNKGKGSRDDKASNFLSAREPSPGKKKRQGTKSQLIKSGDINQKHERRRA